MGVQGEVQAEPGGVSFTGDTQFMYLANYKLRTASRVLLRLSEFYVFHLEDVKKKVGLLNWGLYLQQDLTVSVRVTSKSSRLSHRSLIREEVLRGIHLKVPHIKQVSSDIGEGEKEEEEEEDDSPQTGQLILIRIVSNYCTVSLDSSGEILHKRGYRLETAKAPIRETLAASILMASQWDMKSPLIDPFCGSGTILIEAAMMAHNLPPGRNRTFSFMNWPSFNKKVWGSLSKAPITPNPLSPYISGSDRDEGAIAISKRNSERAGVSQHISWHCHALSNITTEPLLEVHKTNADTPKGWIVTNPPYGKRISKSKDLRNLYAQLGNVLSKRFQHWNVTLVCPDNHLLSSTRIKWKSGFWTENGGIKIKVSHGIVE
eukprot:TRINITY_DN18793_c0_g1_i1.p1 TRINITY_DN18793_c0_g1~~TRINITY_DN18793_c0_g1_i1.p1  ORF type:complete len:402 (-),score=83.90 TRINITY_DN18793_c0_g1_i1:38-1159(-)